MLLGATAIYAGLLALVGLVLQQHVGRERLRAGISLDHGDDEGLLVAMRRQANFVEQVPIALILIAILELNGLPEPLIHLLGTTLLISRIVHPFGLSMHESRKIARFVGAVLTFLVVLAAAIMAIRQPE